MSLPAPLRDATLFIDRSLGRKKVPQILRAAGLRVVTLAEHYGVPQDQSVTDVDWLALAGERGWPVLMKDSAIAVNPAEVEAVQRFGVCCFSLSRKDEAAHAMAGWFLVHLDEIAVVVEGRGACVYEIGRRGLVPVA